VKHQQGIIVGCDQNQEWLLPWWWEHYSLHNNYPVAFADFGMSPKALAWCQTKGESLMIPEPKVSRKIPPAEKKRWESRYGKGIWFCRSAWFKKPLALLHSLFSVGLWLDLDCQVNGSLDPFFNALALGADIGLVREPDFIQDYEEQKGFLLPGEINYNSGVIAFRQSADILQQWAEEALKNSTQYAGDQQALCRAIFNHRPPLIELPSCYNWFRILGPNPEALVYHHTGGQGKIEILKNVNPSLFTI
jgi:hypothetical protein